MATRKQKNSVVTRTDFYYNPCVFDGNKIKIPKIKFSSEAIGVTGTLLGAFIGGFFSLAGSVWVAKMQNKAQREVLKKNIIYKPLYDELIKNDRTLKEYPYPTSVKMTVHRMNQ